jgi:hypothetical protein
VFAYNYRPKIGMTSRLLPRMPNSQVQAIPPTRLILMVIILSRRIAPIRLLHEVDRYWVAMMLACGIGMILQDRSLPPHVALALFV